MNLGMRIQKCKSLWSRLCGFMFSFSRKRAKLFVFPRGQNVSIHMLFVFFPLIVVWLDSQKRIVDFKLMKPFVSLHSADAKYVLEIPYTKNSERILDRLSVGKKLNLF
jgi:uncharacterized membrane protein (UPF0127 family)